MASLLRRLAARPMALTVARPSSSSALGRTLPARAELGSKQLFTPSYPHEANRFYSTSRPSAFGANLRQARSSRLAFYSIAFGVVAVGVTLTSKPLLLESYILGFEDDKVAESNDAQVDPSTNFEFPRVITFKDPKTLPLTLLGVGVRTVSFLKIQVYVVGFYADLSRVDLSQVSTPEEKIDYLIRNKAVAVRIVATRNTGFHHLRDAYIRALQNRLVLKKKENKDPLSPDDEIALAESIQKLKALFPQTSLQKKLPFYMVLSEPKGPNGARTLTLPTLSGQVDNSWIGTELMLYYFAGEGPSPKMKQNAIERVATLQ